MVCVTRAGGDDTERHVAENGIQIEAVVVIEERVDERGRRPCSAVAKSVVNDLHKSDLLLGEGERLHLRWSFAEP